MCLYMSKTELIHTATLTLPPAERETLKGDVRIALACLNGDCVYVGNVA